MPTGPDDPCAQSPNEPDHLAPAYRRALELEAAGADDTAIAAALAVPVESIPSLLRIARAKATRDGSENP